MEQIIKDILLLYGPLGIGWIAATILGWMMFSERKRPDNSKAVIDAYHESIVANTRAMERLATIIEERTRRR